MAATAEILPFPGVQGVPGVPGLEGLDIDRAVEIPQDDGGVIIDFAPDTYAGDETPEPSEPYDHLENLAGKIDEWTLQTISSELFTGIEQDDASRARWLQQRASGIDLLGLEVKKAGGGSSVDNAAPLEGMSSVRHPLLLEATLHFQSEARGELLPARGPVKASNTGRGSAKDDELAKLLERELNTFLTVTATEYYPDTDRLLFQVGWSGAGFKKGFHCPLRRRPVLESIDAKDLIISNNATDVHSAPRVTHVISMDKTTFKRMQIAKAYLDVELTVPEQQIDQVARKVANVQGIDINTTQPQDNNRTIWECYCDIDIPGFEHKIDGEPSGLPLPYKVSIDHTSRKIIEIRRNWKQDDPDSRKRRNFVLYPFVPMFGLYPSGLLHILGNTTSAITAAWRMLLDSGMFSNFPGGLISKVGARQEKTTIRVAPGTLAPVDTGGKNISDAVMALPYKEPGTATMALVDNIAAAGQRLGGTTQIKVGEGNQQAPVGTTLALIEQATVIVSAVHKRLHTSQAEEFSILKELLSEDPEALWRHRKDQVAPEEKAAVVQALQDYDLVPMADPNTPSRMHRLMKCMTVKQLQTQTPEIYNVRAVDEYCLRQIGVDDPEQFFAPEQPAQQQPNPVEIMAQVEHEKNQVKIADIQARSRDKSLDIQVRSQDKAADIQARSQDKAADRASKEAVERMKLMERVATADIR